MYTQTDCKLRSCSDRKEVHAAYFYTRAVNCSESFAKLVSTHRANVFKTLFGYAFPSFSATA